MKTDYWIIAVVLLLLTAVGGMMRFKTTIGQQQEAIEVAWRKQDESIASAYWTRMKYTLPLFVSPLDEIHISSGCGYRMDPMGGGTEGLHKGLDLAGTIGTLVKAASSGVVVERWPAPDGYWHGDPILGGKVVIDCGWYFLIFGHLSASFVHEGDWIDAGDKIGELGDTGICTGPHLHFEVVVDPLRYLEEW